jgi:hypothetical protein
MRKDGCRTRPDSASVLTFHFLFLPPGEIVDGLPENPYCFAPRFQDTDMPSLAGDTIVVNSSGFDWMAVRKSPISLRLFTTL